MVNIEKPEEVYSMENNNNNNTNIKIIKNKLLIALLVLVLLSVSAFGSLLFINYYVKATMEERIITADEAAGFDADCILVLGAGVWDGGRPSHMLEDRLLQGIELYNTGVSDRLLMSGDNGTIHYDEVNVMKDFAMDRDIPSSHIFMDHAGFSTYESMYRARDIFLTERVIVVTQRYHLYRALYIAEKMGIEAYGVASNPRPYAGQQFRDYREVLARVKDFFKVIAAPEPTYLGEVIPVGGDGDLTND